MKGMLSIGLVLCLLMPFIATWRFLSIQLHQIKQEVSSHIDKGEYKHEQVLLKFTHAESSSLYWEHSKEFEYRNEMYDVIRSEVHGDTMYYWCYWDKKETHVKKILNHVLLNALDPGTQNKNTKDHIALFIKSLFFSSAAQPTIFCNTEMASEKINHYYFSVSSFYPFPPFHPPRSNTDSGYL